MENQNLLLKHVLSFVLANEAEKMCFFLSPFDIWNKWLENEPVYKKMQSKYVPMNKQKSAKRTNMRNVSQPTATKKISQKPFNIADLMRVHCAQVWWLFFLVQPMHTIFFHLVHPSLCTVLCSQLQWNPKYYRKMRTSRTSHFSVCRIACVTMHFIYLFFSYWRTVKTI